MPLYPKLEKINEVSDSNHSLEHNQNINMSVGIELVKDMLIKFDGNKSKLFEFIDNCDKANEIIKAEQKHLLFTLIETKLTDNARAIVRNRDFKNWLELKTFLLDTYSEKRTSSQWQLELNSCRQGFNEPVISYANKVENCYIKLTNTLKPNLSSEKREACIELLREQALNVFITGLQKDLSILVKSQKPESLELAIAIALSEEQEIKSKIEINRYQNINNSYTKHCTFCNKPGHSNFNCRFNQKGSNIPPNNIRHFGNKPHSSQQSNSRSNLQFSSNNTKFCNYCKHKGHLIQECRKREYNNRKNKYGNNNNFHRNESSSSQTTQIQTQQPSQNSLNQQGSRDTAQPRNAHMVRAAYT